MPQRYQEICQSQLPMMPWLDRRTNRLPGINPLDWADWLIRDDAFAQQMAYRDHLIATRRDLVFDCMPMAEAAAEELLAKIVAQLTLDPAYRVEDTHVIRPDNVVVHLQSDHPMVVAGRLTQEDHCLLLAEDGAHLLRGAVLCFPASWSLAQKMNRDMFAIHATVAEYGDDIDKRVARMLDRIKPGQPLWRANNLIYSNPDLFQPRVEDNRRKIEDGQQWVRVERQTLARLPQTEALCFGIHTYVLPMETLDDAQAQALVDFLS